MGDLPELGGELPDLAWSVGEQRRTSPGVGGHLWITSASDVGWEDVGDRADLGCGQTEDAQAGICKRDCQSGTAAGADHVWDQA